MPEIWTLIVGAIVLLIVYAVVSSKWKARKQRIAREKSLPFVQETVRTGQRYHIQLSDGRRFQDAELLGTSDPTIGNAPLGGWEGILVILQSNGKKIYVKQSSVRSVEEA